MSGQNGLYEIDPSEAHQRLIATSTHRLLADVARLSDTEVAAPTGLAGWSRGHLLSHLARQVDALERLFTWASTGVVTPQYPSRAARNAEIDLGADRSAADLGADVVRTAEHFQQTIATLPSAAWNAEIRPFTGELCTPKRILVIRLREVEVHHVDLGTGYSFDDVDADAAAVILADVISYLAVAAATPAFTLRQTDGPFAQRFGTNGPDVRGSQGALLGWLTGRSDGAGVSSTGGPLPVLPAWI